MTEGFCVYLFFVYFSVWIFCKLAKAGHGSDPSDWGLPVLVCSTHHLLTAGNNTLISRSIRAHLHNEFV